jgi:hypothetical protein
MKSGSCKCGRAAMALFVIGPCNNSSQIAMLLQPPPACYASNMQRLTTRGSSCHNCTCNALLRSSCGCRVARQALLHTISASNRRMATGAAPHHTRHLLRSVVAGACWGACYLWLQLLLLLLLAHLQAMITSWPRCSSCRASSNPIPVNHVEAYASVQRRGRLRMSILSAASTCVAPSYQAQPPGCHGGCSVFAALHQSAVCGFWRSKAVVARL